ncbi:copper resistance protein NlpE [Pasteurella skyensis]|uniref:Copper resistance protein NlpE n=1 Tax=Phocoenobacter skyensis TaxID=97481 RepID=A0AAJ6NF05_9PAST|nr:copper resistance protein NlpE [Pasteurella skyensis]MDP8171433.1 copper resistance protein NlpE [Pasteurella skyensis]MDP8175627.1 copper resistance protein NlpE [Pasteurella skyensis]
MKKLAVICCISLLSACSLMNKNIAGSYQGTLPCADCDKINAKLILKRDQSYIYETVYFKGVKTYDYIEQGKFDWDKEKNDIITLDDNAGNIKFKVTGNSVEMCDAKGNVTKSNLNYKLQRVITKEK